jgi:hypothetical protein
MKVNHVHIQFNHGDGSKTGMEITKILHSLDECMENISRRH